MKSARPPKPKPHTVAEQLRHLHHQVQLLTARWEDSVKTSADLTAAVSGLTAAVAALEAAPKPVALIDQPTLDAAVQGVTDATTKVIAATVTA